VAVTDRFRITVYDGDFNRKGPLGRFTSLSGEVAFNAPGSATLVVPASHPRAAQLGADGARVRIEYRPGLGFPWSFLMSGYVTETEGTGSRWRPSRTFTVVDDYAALTSEILCWPNPSGALTAQGADGAYFTKTGPAETVLKQILEPNVTRDGIPLTIPTTLGRGSTITCSVRMHYVTERIMPAFEDAGLGVRVTQSGSKAASRTLEVWVPAIHSRVLTQESGVVVDGAWARTPPTVTRVIVGTSGEGTARTFAQHVDTALEAQYKVKLCQFVDARDLDTTATDYATQLAQEIRRTIRAYAEREPGRVRLCGVDGCDGTVKAKGMCNAHYRRAARHGSTERRDGAEWQRAKTHCPHGHEYTPENTYRFSDGRRRCRTCRLERAGQGKSSSSVTAARAQS